MLSNNAFESGTTRRAPHGAPQRERWASLTDEFAGR
jgi:hypothetical protein